MATKRSRAAYEADSQAPQSEFVLYGTPLPLDPDIQDDGSYLPIWKQEVTDDRGRKRLHGAFTGGFSAGYFNTVGSKEGWNPSTFVSSRTNRHKGHDQRKEQSVEDFMDEEDRADAAESQHLQTNQSFSGLGSTDQDSRRTGLIMDLLKPQGETMGVKLLSKMGWRQGQGLGPKILRRPNFDEDNVGDNDNQQKHLFAPQNSPMLTFLRKDDRKGLGFQSEPQLKSDSTPTKDKHESDSDGEDFARPSSSKLKPKPRHKPKNKPAGFGVGVLNDDSDNENEYELGPQISYKKTIGNDKKAKKQQQKATPTSRAANPLLNNKPVFKPKSLLARGGFRKCHDGRLPLDGFVLGQCIDLSSDSKEFERKHAPPAIPDDWTSSKTQEQEQIHNQTSEYQSTADIAKLSTLDPKGRAAILGESQLPRKSIFDFISPASRDRLALATGKSDLPSGLGEKLPGSSAKSVLNLNAEIPFLEKHVAVAALGRGVGGWMPYADDKEKRDRYTAFLEYHGGMRSNGPERPTRMSQDQWLQELKEFAHAAEVFKPMTGRMASRFTSSSSTVKPSDESRKEQSELLSSTSKPEDSAETAASLGMFGPMTRMVKQFYPSHLLCKRFNIKQPSHAQDAEKTGLHEAGQSSKGTGAEASSERPIQALSIQDSPHTTSTLQSSSAHGMPQRSEPLTSSDDVTVDSTKNAALEGERAGEAVFKAIFGSDDEDRE